MQNSSLLRETLARSIWQNASCARQQYHHPNTIAGSSGHSPRCWKVWIPFQVHWGGLSWLTGFLLVSSQSSCLMAPAAFSCDTASWSRQQFGQVPTWSLNNLWGWFQYAELKLCVLCLNYSKNKNLYVFHWDAGVFYRKNQIK